MGEKSGRTSKFAATVLVMVNFLIMVLCAMMFAFGLWIITSPSTLSTVIDKTESDVLKTLLSPQTLTVSLGVALSLIAIFFFFISFMGFYGAITRSPFLLFMYSALILLLLLLECALFYYFSTTLLEKGLQTQDGQWTHALRLVFSCCENNFTTTSPEVVKIPWSCCGTQGFPDNCTAINIFNKNCQHSITTWLHRYQTAIYASLAATHIVLSSCSLLRRARTSRLRS